MDTRLDIYSQEFDPKFALYNCENVVLPFPNATKFASLQEYFHHVKESALKQSRNDMQAANTTSIENEHSDGKKLKQSSKCHWNATNISNSQYGSSNVLDLKMSVPDLVPQSEIQKCDVVVSKCKNDLTESISKSSSCTQQQNTEGFTTTFKERSALRRNKLQNIIKDDAILDVASEPKQFGWKHLFYRMEGRY